MIPTRLSAQVLLDLPPVLSHFLEQERNPWVEGIPRAGKLYLREHQGLFRSLEDLAAERQALLDYLGFERARSLLYLMGFEVGRRDAQVHFEEFKRSFRLALQAPPVIRQLAGGGVSEQGRFEFDLDSRTLYREIQLAESSESAVHRLISKDESHTACWSTAGYFAGNMSELLGRRVITLESECSVKGDKRCRFVSRFEPEWDADADWVRNAHDATTLQQEMAELNALVDASRKAEQRAKAAYTELNRRLRSELMIESLVAESDAMQPVLRKARQVMACDVPYLESGEFGTGKETLARAVHLGGNRKTKPFVPVDCTGLRGHLLTQELFGYVKDAFPGATISHVGAYQRAHGGTLYLSEVANLSIEAQVFLLRAMREGVVFPLGSETSQKADVRVIAATQENLAERVAAGDFLEHLFAAVSVITVDLPPLRERGSDILRLAENYLREFGERYQREELTFSQDFKEALLDCAWPGNVRQLRNTIEHAVIMSDKGPLGLRELPDDVLATRWQRPQEELTEDVVRAALRRTKDNRTHAAELLGVSRTSLWRAMRRLKIR